MNLLALFLEVSDKIPSVERLYLTGLLGAIIVFITTYLNRRLGLAILVVALFLSTAAILVGFDFDINNAVVEEMGKNYLIHFYLSVVFSVVLDILVFILGIKLKTFYQNKRLNLNLK